MIALPFNKKPSQIVGLELQVNGLAVASYQNLEDVPRVAGLEFLSATSESERSQLLKQWVEQHQLESADCHVVLGRNDYQLLLVEPPDVPDEELREALRWRLKDLLNFSVEKAVIDIFHLPEDGTRGNKKMVYVVAVEDKHIHGIINLVRDAGLALQVIDVPELAIRNIASRLICDDDSERGIGVARIKQGRGSVYLYRHGNMYLARNFSLDYNAGLLDDLPVDVLALELQRSIDYYERQMGQAPPAVIYICGEHVSEDKITDQLKASLAVSIQHLDPAATALVEAEEDDDNLRQLCLVAMGAAYRSGKEA